jgi:hypothetical protein
MRIHCITYFWNKLIWGDVALKYMFPWHPSNKHHVLKCCWDREIQMPFVITSKLPCLENRYINYVKVKLILLNMIINQESRCNDDFSGNRPSKNGVSIQHFRDCLLSTITSWCGHMLYLYPQNVLSLQTTVEIVSGVRPSVKSCPDADHWGNGGQSQIVITICSAYHEHYSMLAVVVLHFPPLFKHVPQQSSLGPDITEIPTPPPFTQQSALEQPKAYLWI